MTKEQLFRKIYRLQQEADAYIEKVPYDISAPYVENGFVTPMFIIKDLLMEEVFDEHYPSIEWFLYEWKPGYEVGINGDNTVINNIDEYIEWMKTVEGFE